MRRILFPILGFAAVLLLAPAFAPAALAATTLSVIPAEPTTLNTVVIHIEMTDHFSHEVSAASRTGDELRIELTGTCVLSACPTPDQTFDVPFGFLPAGDYVVHTEVDDQPIADFEFTVVEAGDPPARFDLAVFPEDPGDADRIHLVIAKETALCAPATLEGWNRVGNTFRVTLEIAEPNPICVPPPGDATELGSELIDLAQLSPGNYTAELYAGPPGDPALIQTTPFNVDDDPDSVLLLGRYRVSIEWRTRTGQTGSAFPVALSSAESALFSFFSLPNWEVLVKVLDGCAINNHRWVFLAAATDVEFTLTVVDTQGAAPPYVYNSPAGLFTPPLADTGAFACTP